MGNVPSASVTQVLVGDIYFDATLEYLCILSV